MYFQTVSNGITSCCTTAVVNMKSQGKQGLNPMIAVVGNAFIKICYCSMHTQRFHTLQIVNCSLYVAKLKRLQKQNHELTDNAYATMVFIHLVSQSLSTDNSF